MPPALPLACIRAAHGKSGPGGAPLARVSLTDALQCFCRRKACYRVSPTGQDNVIGINWKDFAGQEKSPLSHFLKMVSVSSPSCLVHSLMPFPPARTRVLLSFRIKMESKRSARTQASDIWLRSLWTLKEKAPQRKNNGPGTQTERQEGLQEGDTPGPRLSRR